MSFQSKEQDLNKTETIEYTYIKEALILKQPLSLCSSIVSEEMRYKSAFFLNQYELYYQK